MIVQLLSLTLGPIQKADRQLQGCGSLLCGRASCCWCRSLPLLSSCLKCVLSRSEQPTGELERASINHQGGPRSKDSDHFSPTGRVQVSYSWVLLVWLLFVWVVHIGCLSEVGGKGLNRDKISGWDHNSFLSPSYCLFLNTFSSVYWEEVKSQKYQANFGFHLCHLLLEWSW
jgi:hypothetical protein